MPPPKICPKDRFEVLRGMLSRTFNFKFLVIVTVTGFAITCSLSTCPAIFFGFSGYSATKFCKDFLYCFIVENSC